jgi:cytochrome P450
MIGLVELLEYNERPSLRGDSGSSWHRRRKLLTPAFHFKILDEFGPMLSLHAKNLVDDLQTQSTPTEAVDVVNIVSNITLRSISRECTPI